MTCTGCNKSGCSGYECLKINQCHGKDCVKSHCVNCFDGKEYDVSCCEHCEMVFCSDCRYSSSSFGRDWVKACPNCMDLINVNIPNHNRSSFSFYSESVWDDVKGANRRELEWGVGQAVMRQYKALQKEDRVIFDKMAVDDSKRYQREMRLFEERHGNVSYQSPYFLYANSLRSKVKAVNPTACFRDIAKIRSKKFDDLPQEELDYWYQQGSADKKSYLREMADPAQIHGVLFS